MIRTAALCRRITLSLLLGLSISLSYSLTDEEIEQRFRLLEQENAALRNKLKNVEKVLKSQGVDPDLPLIETSVKSNNPRELAKELTALKETVEQDRDRFKFSGFMSAGLSGNDEGDGLNHRPYGFHGDGDFNSDSVWGLQFSLEVNDQIRAVTQIVANGWDTWDPSIEWAYLAYDYSEHIAFRAGRMRMPLYLYSESMDVGYSYPWVRPPLTMYTTERSNYDGFDATYHFRTGSISHRASVFIGSFEFKEHEHSLDAQVNGEEVHGVNITSFWNNWTYRLSYVHMDNVAQLEKETGLIQPLPSGGQPGFSGRELVLTQSFSEPLDYYSFGTIYDDGSYLAVLEAARQDVGSNELIGDEVLGVLTLGYHIDKWLPFIGYGREYYLGTLDANGPARTRDRDYKMLFLGLRYDIIPGVSAKFEWDHYYDFEGTSGPFEDSEAFKNGLSFDEVNVYTFLIDAVF